MVTFEVNSVKEFLKGFRGESTKETYQKKLLQFLNHIDVEPDQFLARTMKDPKKTAGIIFKAPGIPAIQKATVERILALYTRKL